LARTVEMIERKIEFGIMLPKKIWSVEIGKNINPINHFTGFYQQENGNA
jgi:hypothetical protein